VAALACEIGGCSPVELSSMCPRVNAVCSKARGRCAGIPSALAKTSLSARCLTEAGLPGAGARERVAPAPGRSFNAGAGPLSEGG
jgi:hypothetical protein